MKTEKLMIRNIGFSVRLFHVISCASRFSRKFDA